MFKRGAILMALILPVVIILGILAGLIAPHFLKQIDTPTSIKFGR